MPDTTDRIAEHLDAAIGAPPPSTVDVDQLLARGRRAQARRRLALGVGTAAATVAVAGGAWALAPGGSSEGSDSLPAAGSPSPSADAPADGGADAESEPWAGSEGARWSPAAGLEVRPGWTLEQKVPDVAGPGTMAAEVSRGDRLQWFIWVKGTTYASQHAPEPGYASFAEWIDVNAPIAADDHTDGPGNPDTEMEWPGVPRDDLVAFTADGRLAPVGGATILAQEAPIDLGASFAPPGQSAVAEVEVDGERWYVVARRPGDFIAVRAAKGGATLAEFIEFARGRYAEGGGGLL